MEVAAQTWIALFRGINVGGKNLLPMATLREILGGFDLQNIRTYIQSGNVVFDAVDISPIDLAKKIVEGIQERQGFSPSILLLTRAQLQAAADANPFPGAISDPKSLHFLFLAERPVSPNLDSMQKKKSTTERFVLTDSVFYLHAPEGIGRSKLAAVAEKNLGVVTTGRNYRTVKKLLEMVLQDGTKSNGA